MTITNAHANREKYLLNVMENKFMENEENLKQTLRLLSGHLKNLNYVFIGSVNLFLQGMKMVPRDIDILTTADDIILIDKILMNYRTKEIYFYESNERNSFRSFYNINGYEIEVLGNVNNTYRKLDYSDDTILIDHDDNIFPCMSLLAEAEVYRKMGRVEKAKIIEDFVDNDKTIEAIKCILINKDCGKLLLVKQNKDKDDLWVCPGGKLEVGESVDACVRREMDEELNLSLNNLKNIGKLKTHWENEIVLFHCFVCQVDNEYFTIDGRELKEARWYLLSELPTLGPTTKTVLEIWKNIK